MERGDLKMGVTVRRLLLVVVSLCAVLFGLTTGSGPVAAKSAAYERFDVTIDLQPDGTFHVVETQVVDFSDGPFSRGYRELPLARTEGIERIRVGEVVDGTLHDYVRVELQGLGSPATYAVSRIGGSEYVYWDFEPVISGQRTFVVSYDVRGALRTYRDEDPANQQIWWTAVSDDLAGETPVHAAEVTITLPEPVDLAAVRLGEDGRDDPAEHSADGRSFTWQAEGLGDGDELIVRLQFPPVVDAAPPSWQQADDEQRAREAKSDERTAYYRFAFLAAGLLLAAGGGTGVYGLWYARGRDPHTGLVADFLPTPPDDLPAGVVGTLLDEEANECDIVATFLALGHRGVIKITDVGTLGPLKTATRHDYLIEMVQPEAPVDPFEREVIRVIFGRSAPSAGDTARLREIGHRLAGAVPEIRRELYADLVEHGYFTRSPEETRRGWRKGGIVVAILSIVAGIVGMLAVDWVAVFPATIGAILGGGLVWLSRAMPRKTAAGAEAAAKWRAFRRYLTDIDRYESLPESRGIFDRYLPFAVAFGIDKTWVRRFSMAGATVPSWLDTIGIPDFGGPSTGHGPSDWTIGRGPYVGTGGSLSDVDLPDVDMPDLQQTSDRAARGLQSGSSGLSEVLNVVGAILEVAAAFSGGGGRGGSSGGGGGGFR